ncbi:ABC transporter permease [Microtetraspora sp. AC03309]|uniref:ABC transporter permease n=1 Tax=Microtetraspora sp. AC03309 TaxID=2779376 RepID=UPI001E594349|nr:ABC transporter permease [Microtetraspora sp. AC03309]MCC5576161.1 ABC transporter permease [Microtetraspora sp. AC03309]
MSASVAVLKAEALLFRREPVSVFWILAFPVLLLVVVGLVPSFRAEGSAPAGARSIDLYVPVTVLLGMIMAGLQSLPPTLTGYREKGILRRMSTTPVRPAALLAAQVIVHGGAALAGGIVVITAGRLLYGVALPANLPAYALTLVLVTLGALVSGALIAALSRTAKASTAAATIIFFPAAFTAGVYIPVQSMPETMQRVVELTPFGAASQALAQATSGGWPALSYLAIILVWITVLAGASVRWFRWE